MKVTIKCITVKTQINEQLLEKQCCKNRELDLIDEDTEQGLIED